MNVNVTDLAPWVAIVVSILSAIYAALNGRSKKVDADMADLRKDHKADHDATAIRLSAMKSENDMLKERITRVESEIEHLPDKDATHRLEMALASMQTEMRGLSEKVKPISAMADRIQEAMLDKVMS